MWEKLIIGVFFLVILYCLGSALFYMLSRHRSENSMAKALTWRVVLSLILFLLLMVGFYMGWIKPHGI